MSNVIRIKRRASGSAGAPSSLMDSELAYNQVDDTIWIGKGTGGAGGSATTIEAIAGKGAFLALAGAQVVTGDKEFSGAIDFSGTIEIDGVAITATAAELNKLAGVTPGTASASKALVVDSSKDLDLDGGDLTVADFTASGDVVISGNLTVNGATTVINSTTVSVDDKLIELGSTASPSDATADGGGIVLKGTTDKSIIFTDATDSWDLSEHANLASGKAFKINGTEVLSGSALGSGVTSSSLTSVGTLTSGALGAGFTTVAIAQGGTGQTSAQAAINALSQVSGATVGHVLTKVGTDAVWAAPADTGISSLNGLTSDTQTFAVGSSGTDFNISSSSSTHTFNIPNAGSSARGLVSTGTQTFAGAKTFSSDVTVSASYPKITMVNTEGGNDAILISAFGNFLIKQSNSDLIGKFPFRISLSDHKAGINRYTPYAQLHVQTWDGGTKGLIVTGAPSQSANYLELQNYDEVSQFTVNSAGAVTVGSWQATDVAVAHGGTGASDAATARENLGVEIGVDVQAYSDKLQSIVDLSGSFSSGVVKIVGYSDANTAEYVDTTVFSRSLLDDASASAARTTLELVPGTDVQAYSANLSALAGLTSASDKLPYFTGSGTAAVADFSSFGRSLVDDADASAARSTLALGSIATQAADNVSITGGSIDNVTFDGGTF